MKGDKFSEKLYKEMADVCAVGGPKTVIAGIEIDGNTIDKEAFLKAIERKLNDVERKLTASGNVMSREFYVNQKFRLEQLKSWVSDEI